MNQQLQALRTAIPGCNLVAFGDLDARLLFRANHDRTIHRENLDKLCLEAVTCFEILKAIQDGTPASKGEDVPEEVIILSPGEVKVFVISEVNKADFICLVCEPSCDSISAAALARQHLNRLSKIQ